MVFTFFTIPPRRVPNFTCRVTLGFKAFSLTIRAYLLATIDSVIRIAWREQAHMRAIPGDLLIWDLHAVLNRARIAGVFSLCQNQHIVWVWHRPNACCTKLVSMTLSPSLIIINTGLSKCLSCVLNHF